MNRGEQRELRPAFLWTLGLAMAVVPASVCGQPPRPLEAISDPQEIPTPMSPQQSMAATHVPEGFRLELVAAEPLVADPVAIDWGPDGRLWVAEMSDYPSGDPAAKEAGGRIRVLVDSNHDGRYDISQVILQGVNFPTGIMAWRQGALVTAAPEIFYIEDADGDGRPERRETLISGFYEGNQQLRVNGLRWGLDNWVYCASGSHHAGYGADTRVHSLRASEDFTVGSRDFRFQPDTGKLQSLSGPAQFGRNRDDWGNWFGVQNSYPLWVYVLEDHYIRRNPDYAPSDPRFQILAPANPPVFPAKAPQKRFHSFEQAGRFTSACSAMVYRDDLLFERQPQVEHAFTCEPFHNLVQHNIIQDRGTVFRAYRDTSEGEVDFFASKDRWCRPVMVRTGPDGALWVVDMYRYMIEHPEWLPPEGRDELRPYYRFGEGMGRIYRVVRSGTTARRPERLDRLSGSELVQVLESSNGWQRDTAQRLLIEREETAAAPLLRSLVRTGNTPLGRLHALCTLDGLGQLDAATLMRGLEDPHPSVRRHAVRLAEGPAASDPALLSRAVGLAHDPDAKVRLQLACSLGQWTAPAAAQALADLLRSDSQDPYLVAAVMSSLTSTNVVEVTDAYLDGWSDDTDASSATTASILISQAAAKGGGQRLTRILAAALNQARQSPSPAHWILAAGVLQWLSHSDSEGREVDTSLRQILDQIVAQARQTLVRPDAELQLRMASVGLLLRDMDHRGQDLGLLGSVLRPDVPPELQQVVVDYLGRQKERAVAGVLLADWSGHSPELKRRILGLLTTRDEWSEVLLEQLQQQQIPVSDVGLAVRNALRSSPKDELRARGALLFAADVALGSDVPLADRIAAVHSFRGDADRGEGIFRQHCASCHEVRGALPAIGPQLASLTDRSVRTLATAILDPNQAVEAKYMALIVVLDDGRSMTGVVAAETASSLTLAAPDGGNQVILRRDIDQMQRSGKSLMPEGWESELTTEQLADLIAYIQTMR